MEPVFDVIGLGCTAVDDLIYVDQYPQRDAKIPVRRRERQCGGLTATALVAAARLGARCAYAGTLGCDELSQFAIDRFREEGICLDYLRRSPETLPIQSMIVVDDLHHTRNVFFDLARSVPREVDWPAADVIRGSRVLFVDQLGAERMARAARIARDAAIPVVADFEGGEGPAFVELVAMVDHLILSEDYARQLTGADSAVRAAEVLWTAHRQAVVVTCGRNGCWFLSREHSAPRQQSAFRVCEVDTTGCGDVFHGAYAAALARHWPVSHCIEYAAATAALKATRPGGQAGAPTHSAVISFLAEHPTASGQIRDTM